MLDKFSLGRSTRAVLSSPSSTLDRRAAQVTTQPKSDPKLTPEREAELRRLLGLEYTATEDELAELLHCSTKTVQRADLPYIVIPGGRRLYDLRAAGAKLRRIARAGAPGPDDAEGDLPPAVRYRRRIERDTADTG